MSEQDHILVVEDEPITREQLVSYFEDEGFRVSSTGNGDEVQKIVDDRTRMAAGELTVDWGFAETMAYASLLTEGFGLRLVGQGFDEHIYRDGVPSHRHGDQVVFSKIRGVGVDEVAGEECVGFEGRDVQLLEEPFRRQLLC